MKMESGKLKNNSGFTLIEMLISIVIMSMLGLALLSLQYIINQNQIVVWRSYTSVDEANRNVSSLVRELRTARSGDNGAFQLELADDNSLTFYSDVDFDGATERVRYFLVGNDLSKGVIEPTGFPVTYPAADEKVRILTENVRNTTNPVFYYYNEDWPEDTIKNPLTTPANPSDITLIRIFLKVNTQDDPEGDYVLESYAQLRTLKENL